MASESIYAKDGFWDDFDEARNQAKLAGDIGMDMGRSPTVIMLGRAFISIYNPTSDFAFSDEELQEDFNNRLVAAAERAVASYSG